MAHFAQLDGDNIVLQVIVVDDSDCLDMKMTSDGDEDVILAMVVLIARVMIMMMKQRAGTSTRP